MIKGFLAYELALKLNRKAETMGLKHCLQDQLERAAQSIVLNLAEGSGKPSPKDKRRFYAIAFGSLREVQAVIDIIESRDSELIETADRLGGQAPPIPMLWRLHRH